MASFSVFMATATDRQRIHRKKSKQKSDWIRLHNNITSCIWDKIHLTFVFVFLKESVLFNKTRRLYYNYNRQITAKCLNKNAKETYFLGNATFDTDDNTLCARFCAFHKNEQRNSELNHQFVSLYTFWRASSLCLIYKEMGYTISSTVIQGSRVLHAVGS